MLRPNFRSQISYGTCLWHSARKSLWDAWCMCCTCRHPHGILIFGHPSLPPLKESKAEHLHVLDALQGGERIAGLRSYGRGWPNIVAVWLALRSADCPPESAQKN